MQFQHARESCVHSRDGREAIHHLEAETGLDALCDVNVFGNGTDVNAPPYASPRACLTFGPSAWHTDAVTGDDGKLQVTLCGPATHAVN